MADILQRFSTGNMVSMLGVMIAAWMAWPVLCGVLGAKRCGVMQGVMHGLLWGPIGVVVVLASRAKCVCPTCGQRTLTKPVDAAASVPTMPPAGGIVARPLSVPASDVDATGFSLNEEAPPPPPIVSERIETAPVPADLDSLLSEACAGYSEEERERLRSWVVGS